MKDNLYNSLSSMLGKYIIISFLEKENQHPEKKCELLTVVWVTNTAS